MRPKRYRTTSDKFSYICSAKEQSHGELCHNVNCVGQSADKLVKDIILNFEVNGNIINHQLNQLRNNINNYETESGKMITQIKKQIADKQQDIANLLSAINAGVSNNTAILISQQIDTKTDEINALQKRLDEMSNIDNVKEELLKHLKDTTSALTYLRDNFDTIPITVKREFIRKIVDKVVWDGDTIDIFIKGAE